jgi:hypothetical protein
MIGSRRTPFFVGIVYRPPGSVAAFWENFEYSIEQAMNYA